MDGAAKDATIERFSNSERQLKQEVSRLEQENQTFLAIRQNVEGTEDQGKEQSPEALQMASEGLRMNLIESVKVVTSAKALNSELLEGLLSTNEMSTRRLVEIESLKVQNALLQEQRCHMAECIKKLQGRIGTLQRVPSHGVPLAPSPNAAGSEGSVNVQGNCDYLNAMYIRKIVDLIQEYEQDSPLTRCFSDRVTRYLSGSDKEPSLLVVTCIHLSHQHANVH